jgi:DNA polymerase (family X)
VDGNSENAQIAARLEEAAQLLQEQSANPYRVRAYRRAAEIIGSHGVPPISQVIAERGMVALTELPGIGERLARSLYQLVKTGRLPVLDRLRGEADPLELIASVPGIGTRTALRIHDVLGVSTLEELEIAAYDGRLQNLIGFGGKRLAGVRDSLAGRLGRVRTEPAVIAHQELPSVAELLEVDAQYRRESMQGKLKLIAPRRFNPEHKAWLPVLHCERGERHYTALFSNTEHAHKAGRTDDWVILYFNSGAGDRQCTVITARRGPLKGHRIIRGREAECLDHYGIAKLGAVG